MINIVKKMNDSCFYRFFFPLIYAIPIYIGILYFSKYMFFSVPIYENQYILYIPLFFNIYYIACSYNELLLKNYVCSFCIGFINIIFYNAVFVILMLKIYYNYGYISCSYFIFQIFIITTLVLPMCFLEMCFLDRQKI